MDVSTVSTSLDYNFDKTTKPIIRSESLLSIESREFCKLMEDFLEIEMIEKKKKISYGKYKLIKGDDIIIRQNDVCPICLEDYSVGKYKRVLECGHVFDKKCIDRWFNRLNDECMEIKCPVCRKLKKCNMK